MNRRVFLLAGTGSLAMPLDTLARTALAAPATALAPVSASAVLNEAQCYLGVRYRYGGADPTIGLDCSAYISLAWKIPRQSTDTIQAYSYEIAKGDLMPGDAMNRPFAGRQSHIRLFAGWATADRLIAWVYESSHTYDVSYHLIAYDDHYTPIRRNGFVADVPMPEPVLPLDYDVPNGHFYSQTGGRDGLTGFTVSNENRIKFWDEYRRLGGVDALGFPVTGRFDSWGRIVQVLQNGVLHWNPDLQMADLGPPPPDLTTAAPAGTRAAGRSPLLPKTG